ncbi:MAG: hypothetical protein EXR02_04155 [Rhodospirillales bacterium]|nr:hypothetical protein [Rhodospirillales bacterium]
MPPHIKIPLSVVVVLVGGAILWIERSGDLAYTGWIAFALSLFMVFAIWLFPEASAKKKEPGG